MERRRPRSSRSQLIVVLLAGVLTAAAAIADPPADPPPVRDLVEFDPVFCARVTDFRQHPSADERLAVEFELVNWTAQDTYGLLLSLNTGGGGLEPGSPRFIKARVDTDGRPIVGDPMPPRGNPPKINDWTVTQQTSTRIVFSAGTPVPHPTTDAPGGCCHGLLDPRLADLMEADAKAALTDMIPGSFAEDVSPTEWALRIPDPETIDDHDNWLDGMIVAFGDWDCGEEVSINWYLLGQVGQPIGQISQDGGAIQGDQFGFGTANYVRLCPAGVGDAEDASIVRAPPALFTINFMDPGRINSGYDPPDTSDPDADSALFWAEDTDADGHDQYLVNPIPPGKDGAGIWLAFEPGAAITAAFADPADADEFGLGISVEALPDDCRLPGGLASPDPSAPVRAGDATGDPRLATNPEPALDGLLGTLAGTPDEVPVQFPKCLQFNDFCDSIQIETVSGDLITATWNSWDCAGTDGPGQGRVGVDLVSACDGSAAHADIRFLAEDGNPGDFYFLLDTLDGTMDMHAGLVCLGSCWIDELNYTLVDGPCAGIAPLQQDKPSLLSSRR